MKKILSKHKRHFTFVLMMIGMLTGTIAPLQRCYSQSSVSENNATITQQETEFINIAGVNSNVQPPLPCGNGKIDVDALHKALDYEKTAAPEALTSYLIRVFFHICTYDDGSNATATEAQIATEFNTLVSTYSSSSSNICFLNCGVGYVNSSAIDTNWNANTDSWSVFSPYLVPNCINIFYMTKIKGGNGACNCGIGGITETIPGTTCLVAQGNIGQGQTVAHETGHCLGMYHPFETAFGEEDINESNCSSAGDLICDTHADPYSFNQASCFKLTSGSPKAYDGNCEDPNGAKNFTPPYTNLMTYWWVYGYKNLVVTAGQYTRINSFLSTNSSLQACESFSGSASIGPLSFTGGFYFASAVNTLSTTGNVDIGNGPVFAVLGGGSVQLNPGFDANANGFAYIAIEPSACSYSARIADPNAEIASTDNSTVLSIYPNPSHDKFTFHYQLLNDQPVKISIYNAELKLVKQVLNSNQITGVYDEVLDVSNFDSGVYFAKFETGTDIKTSKLVVLK